MPEGPKNLPAGQSIPRVDGGAKIRGAAKYTDDIKMAGVWYGHTVRSTVAHATLDALVRDPSFDWRGVVVVTAEAIPNNKVLFLVDDQPALVPVGGEIKHPDEPIALVACADKQKALEAARAITAEVTALPLVETIAQAEAAAVKLHGDDNLIQQFEINKGAPIDEALAKADVVIEGTYETGAQEQMYLEPQAVLAWWDDDGRCHVRGSLQCPYYVHKALKGVLALDDDHLIISQAATGGAFGGKEEYPNMISAHAALLAKAAGAPVKIVYDREEDIAATTKRHPSVTKHRLGVNRDGTIVAMDVDLVLDGGAYVTCSPVVLSRAVLHASGPFRCENVHVRGRAFATNKAPFGAYRGFGAPQATFAFGRQIAKAARALGVEPFAFYEKNVLREGDQTATGQRLDESVASEEVLAAVTEALAKPQPGPRVESPLVKRGRGSVIYFHGAGFTGSGEERINAQGAVAITEDGAFEVRVAATDMGQGASTTLTQIAAAALGVPHDAVTIATPDTSKVPNSGPTVASRTCMVVGSVVEQASYKLVDTLEAFAAEAGLDKSDKVALARAYAEKNGERQENVTYKLAPGKRFDDDTYTGDAYPAFGWACCAADVAIDPDTYEVTVERLIHAVDVGKAINPTIVKGQIEGGTLQAVGWALLENVIYREGRVANRHMTDCIIPTACDVPELETIIVEVPFSRGPFGAKGLGELPMDGPGAAVANAIEEALQGELGAHAPDRLPLLPEIIAQIVHGQPGRQW